MVWQKRFGNDQNSQKIRKSEIVQKSLENNSTQKSKQYLIITTNVCLQKSPLSNISLIYKLSWSLGNCVPCDKKKHKFIDWTTTSLSISLTCYSSGQSVIYKYMSKENQRSPDDQTTFFSNCSNMESQQVPKELKDAIIITIYKKCDQKSM